MKGLIVFSQINDVVFLSLDAELNTHLKEKAVKLGLIEASSVHGRESIDPNVIMQMFAPLVASQRFMTEQVHNPYSSVTMENSFKFVFKQYEGQIHLCINGDSSENEQIMKRKLLVLQRVLRFMFGPVSKQLRSTDVRKRKEIWELLSKIMATWSHLQGEEQSFLVEAVERLQVSQNLSEECIKILEKILGKLRASGDHKTVHALLLAGCKRLALYSSRNAQELKSDDILLIALLVQSTFPSGEKLEDLLSQVYQSDITVDTTIPEYDTEDKEHYVSAREETDLEASNSDYYSPSASPANQSEDETDKSTSQVFVSPRVSMDTTADLDARFSTSTSDAHDQSGSVPPVEESEERRSQSNDWAHCSGQLFPTPPDIQCQTVFLRSNDCPYTPYVLNSIQILPGVVLVLIKEMPRSSHALLIYKTLAFMETVLTKTPKDTSGKLTQHSVDVNIKKLSDISRKYKGEFYRHMRIVRNNWERAKTDEECSLINYLERNNDTRGSGRREDRMNTTMPNRLENKLCNVVEELKLLFHFLYLNTKHEASHIYNEIQQTMQRKLEDYKDYLTVKVQRNIAMTGYVEDFPGLVHFIYVNRSCDQLIVPSINVVNDHVTTEDPSILVKAKVWKMFRWFQTKVEEGFVSMTRREGDFHYVYVLWFEDTVGNPLTPQTPYDGSSPVPAGILAGGFYRSLIQRCFPHAQQSNVCCYELMCIHIGLVPTQYALAHCKKLAAQLWESESTEILL